MSWTLLPPKEGVCQECAVDHPPDLPHDQESLYYQYHFLAEYGRWPTWDDAMAHCSDEMKATWREELAKALARREREAQEVDSGL